MTTQGPWSDEQLNAFVDGELEAPDAARLAQQLPQDALLAARVERQRALRARLAAAFDPVLDEAVPARLLQVLEGGSGVVTPIGASGRRTHATAPRGWWWGAAAASVLAALLIGWSLPRAGSTLLVPTDEGLLAAGILDEALSGQLAGETAAGGIHIALSFRDREGRYCRVFRLQSGVDGLACRGTAGWQVQATGSLAPQSADEYRQASSALSPAVIAAIAGGQAGEVLTPEQESEGRATRWR